MNEHTPIPLSAANLSQEEQDLLAKLWVTSLEELIAMSAAIHNSSHLLESIVARQGGLSRAFTAARSTLQPERFAGLSRVRPGGLLGCRVDPTLLSEFRSSGRLRPASARPTRAFKTALPPAVRLLDKMPPVRDQGERGTCVAFGTVALREFLIGCSQDLSEQFLYWACKDLDGTPDEGTFVHTAISALAQYGVCEESVWPYNPCRTNDEGQGPPPDRALDNGRQYRLESARTVEPNLVAHYKNVLAGNNGTDGMPVTFATLVFESWHQSPETYRTGKITLPLPGEQYAGGHAWCVVGYVDDENVPGGGYFIVRNSWGAGWAAESPEKPGHAMMPYEYVERYAAEAFTGPLVESTPRPRDSQTPRESQAARERFCRTLERPERDVEGRLLRAGTPVLCNPAAHPGSGPAEIYEDTPENRAQFLDVWTLFPDAAALSQETRAAWDRAHAAREQFFAIVKDNLAAAARSSFPKAGLPWWTKLIPWPERLGPMRVAADLDEALAAAARAACGVREGVAWPEAWKTKVAELNGCKVYAARWMGVTVHAVVAFASRVQFEHGAPPRIEAPSQALVQAVQQVYRQWLDKQRTKPAATFYGIGSPQPFPAGVQPTVPDAAAVVLAQAPGREGRGGGWKVFDAAGETAEPSWRALLDALKPQTRQERFAMIKAAVDELLETGYEGNIHVEKISAETGCRKAQVRAAFRDLARTGRYETYRTSSGVPAVRRRPGALAAAAPGSKVSSAGSRPPGWLVLAVAALAVFLTVRWLAVPGLIVVLVLLYLAALGAKQYISNQLDGE